MRACSYVPMRAYVYACVALVFRMIDTPGDRRQMELFPGFNPKPTGAAMSSTTPRATPKRKPKSRLPTFYAGIALALAELARLHGEDVAIKDVLGGIGLTIADLKQGGAQEYDLKAIRQALKGLGQGRP